MLIILHRTSYFCCSPSNFVGCFQRLLIFVERCSAKYSHEKKTGDRIESEADANWWNKKASNNKIVMLVIICFCRRERNNDSCCCISCIVAWNANAVELRFIVHTIRLHVIMRIDRTTRNSRSSVFAWFLAYFRPSHCACMCIFWR